MDEKAFELTEDELWLLYQVYTQKLQQLLLVAEHDGEDEDVGKTPEWRATVTRLDELGEEINVRHYRESKDETDELPF